MRSDPLRVLLVDRDERRAAHVRTLLDDALQTVQSVTAGTPAAAVDALSRARYSIVLFHADAADVHAARGTEMLLAATTSPVLVLVEDEQDATCAAVRAAGAAECAALGNLTPESLGRVVAAVVARHRESRQLVISRHLLDRLGQAAATTDEEGLICSWNAAAERLYGRAEADVLGQSLLDTTMAEQPCTGDEPAFSVLRGEGGWSGEERHRHAHGEEFAVEVSYQAVRNERDRIIGMTVVAAPLESGGLAGAKDLLQDHQALRAVVDASPVAIVAQSSDHLVTMWNPAAERMFGWKAAEVLGRPLPFVPEHDQARRRRHMAMAMRGEVPAPFEAERLTRDGRLIRVAITTAPIYGPSGEYHGVMGLLEDVTERRAGEEQQRRLHEVVEASPSFVATFGADGRAIYVNAAGRRLLGLEPTAEFRHLSLHNLHTAAAADVLVREALPAVTTAGSWTGETTLRSREGTGIPVWESLVAHHNDLGELAFISVVADDLSERRRLEEQLRQAQKMDAVGRLAGGVAHEFNNLLTAIAGHTQILLDQMVGVPEQRQELEEVMDAVEQAATLTKQLLAFSRRQVLQPRVLDVNDVVRETAGLLSRLIGSGIEVRLDLQSRVSAVRVDRSQLQQVLLNLVVNARDAMPAGGTLEIATMNLTLDEREAESFGGVAPGGYTALRIRDTGEGMDEDVIPRIFEPFFTTRDYGRGAGLGLPTVYGIVTQSGGGVRVHSRRGSGTTFEVVLPAVADAVSAPAADVGGYAASAPGAAPPVSRRRGVETILLAEDEPAVRRLGVRILERSGYRVLEAESGVAAIELFRNHADTIAMLVSDVVMPGMNGPELAQRLKELKPTLPVLFTSGYTADAISRIGGLPPGTAFLEKPFTPDALSGKVRQMLDSMSQPT